MSFYIRKNIYWIADKNLTLPPEKLRGEHRNQRPALLISTRGTEFSWKIALVIPISTSPKFQTKHCVKVPKDIGGLTSESWVRVPAIQPISKSEIGSRIGELPADYFELVEARLLEYMGIL